MKSPITDGDSNQWYKLSTGSFESNSDRIQVRFESDGSGEGRGFQMVVTDSRNSECANTDFRCDGTRWADICNMGHTF